jgi:LCP family protein required for cell wall assembly
VRGRAGFVTGVVAKVAVSLVATSVLGLTGYAWAVLRDLSGRVVVTDVLSPGAGGTRPLDGAVDILLVGMDSRTDAQGNPLADEQRKLLRVDAADGEVNTDTIILVHIPTDTSKAVAISIPRDSFVDIPGYGQHKINSAYPRGKNVERQRLQARGAQDAAAIERRSNEAGAKVLIAAVEQLTGRTVDHYASVNLLGFYDITNAIGGVEVCLKHPVDDVKSHAKFPAGRQIISGRDALAFVRQRLGLPRGDLDRVVRQQVFLTGMTRKVLSAGTLSSPARLEGLIDAISRSVVLSKGWDIMAFAQRMSSLSGGQVQFRTIPVGSLALPTPEDGAAVEVDPVRVREFIGKLSGEPEPEVRPQAQTSTTPTFTPPPSSSSRPSQPADDPITADELPCVN